ncbi:hypothetical protein [Catenulispora rubra]|nr:hypothetical protein [Catenulispora rubra]
MVLTLAAVDAYLTGAAALVAHLRAEGAADRTARAPRAEREVGG